MPANPTRYTLRIHNTVTLYQTQTFPCGNAIDDAEKNAERTARDVYTQCVVEVLDTELGDTVVRTVPGKISPDESRIAAEARIMAALIRNGATHEPPPDWKARVESELAKLQRPGSK